jgi:hypothetical protein
MHMHRGFFDSKAGADFLVGQACHEAGGNVVLAATQARKPLGCRLARPVQSAQDCILSLRAEDGPPLGKRADRLRERFGCGQFEEDAVGAGGAVLEDLVLANIAADDHGD